MQLQDLTIYQQLFQLVSINQVAEVMGFAQSNVSARLQVLENEFNVQFFNRTYQGIIPTKAGITFYQYTQKVLRQTALLKQNLALIQNEAQPAKQHVVISTLLFDLLVI